MANAVASIDASPISPSIQPLQSPGLPDDHLGLAKPRYWPTELLATFTLQMAGHGRCVSSAMMLGDREYALFQLARAHTLDDEHLRAVAVQLFAYFDEA
jgi:hypothetical protein